MVRTSADCSATSGGTWRPLGIARLFGASVAQSTIPALVALPAVASLVPDTRVRLAAVDGHAVSGDLGALTSVARRPSAPTATGCRLHGQGRGRRAHRLRRRARQGASPPRQGRQRRRPVVRVAGPRPALPRHVRARHAHGRHHRGSRRGAARRTATTAAASWASRPVPASSTSRSPTPFGTTDVSQVIAAIGWVVEHRDDHGLEHPGAQPVVRHGRRPELPCSTRSRTRSSRPGARASSWSSRRATRDTAPPAEQPRLRPLRHRGRRHRPPGHRPRAPTTWSPPSPASATRSRRPGRRGARARSILSACATRARTSTSSHPGGRVGRPRPACSGAAAPRRPPRSSRAPLRLLIDQRPSIKPDQLKTLLTRPRRSTSTSRSRAQGAGLIDLARARSDRHAAERPEPSPVRPRRDPRCGTRHAAAPEPGRAYAGRADIFGDPLDLVVWVLKTLPGDVWVGGASWTGRGPACWCEDTWAGRPGRVAAGPTATGRALLDQRRLEWPLLDGRAGPATSGTAAAGRVTPGAATPGPPPTGARDRHERTLRGHAAHRGDGLPRGPLVAALSARWFRGDRHPAHPVVGPGGAVRAGRGVRRPSRGRSRDAFVLAQRSAPGAWLVPGDSQRPRPGQRSAPRSRSRSTGARRRASSRSTSPASRSARPSRRPCSRWSPTRPIRGARAAGSPPTWPRSRPTSSRGAAVQLVIAVSTGERPEWSALVGRGTLFTLTNASLGLVGVLLLASHPTTAWLRRPGAGDARRVPRVGPRAGEAPAARGAPRGDRQRPGVAGQRGRGAGLLVARVATMFGAERAELVLLADGATGGPAVVLGADRIRRRSSRRSIRPRGSGRGWRQRGRACGWPGPGARSAAVVARAVGRPDLMAAPVRGARGVEGVLTVMNRVGNVGGWPEDELPLLETLANHAAVAIRNGELVDGLAARAAESEQLPGTTR